MDELKWSQDSKSDDISDLRMGDTLVGWACSSPYDGERTYTGYTVGGYVSADTFEELKALIVVAFRMNGK